jgi:hypothetical protein
MIGELIPTGVTFGTGRQSLNSAFSGTAAFNNITLDSGGNFAAGTGGGIITSGGTDLYNIFLTNATDATTASNGITKTGVNVTLGGTLTGDTFIDNSGFVLRANEFSATTITAQDLSGGTNGGVIYSAGTDLYNIFALAGGTSGDVTRVANGTNITTGGTENIPTINLDDNIDLVSVKTSAGFSGGQDTNATSYLGRAAVGYGAFSDFAWFSHVDQVSGTGYALVQGPDGSTTINATNSSNGIGFRLDNNDAMRISATTGYVAINTNVSNLDEQLVVTGSIRMKDGTEGVGKTLVDIGNGKMAWSAITGGGGETNTASNLAGGGNGIFKQKSGVDLEFRTLSAGTNIQIVTGDTITINGGGGTVHDYGSVSGTHDWNITNESANAKLRFAGNITALNILNATPGTFGTLELEQTTGGHTLVLGTGTHKVVNGGAGAITLTATASAIDIISFFYDGSTFFWTVGNNYT